MAARILSVGTAVPATRLSQSQVRDFFAAQPGIDRLAARLIHAAFDQSAIDTRHTVIAELGDAVRPRGRRLRRGGLARAPRPSTGTRNALYRREAPALFAAAAADALEARRGRGIRGHPHRDRLLHGLLRAGPRLPARAGPRHPHDRRAVPPGVPRLRRRVPRAARRHADRRRAARRRRARRVRRAVLAAHPLLDRPRADRRVGGVRRRRRRGRRHLHSPARRRAGVRDRRVLHRDHRARARATWSGRSATRASR